MFYTNESCSFEWTIDRSLVMDVRCNRSERIKGKKLFFKKNTLLYSNYAIHNHKVILCGKLKL